MNNREIYLYDPATRKLVNEGVVRVSDDTTEIALLVLKYELETFVCDGQYGKGLEHILETYLKNIDQAQQPGVWVSGFYGSGKSHLVKMLRALWVDTQFKDGSTARGIANLPQNIQDLLKELTIKSKRYGGLHAASGTLGSGVSGSLRLALLGIVFKSAGLPEMYHQARFVMWLKNEEIYNEVRHLVEKNGLEWEEELDYFYVSEALQNALMQVKANLFSSNTICVDTLNNMFPFVTDVSNDEMIKAIRQALTRDGKFPLTLIVLDEIQQYIGEDSLHSNDVQEVVESCCKNIGGKLLFVGTGQTAVTGTNKLKKLEGRFPLRVELSDSDVDTVVRKVILAKKPGSIEDIKQTMETNIGEVSRHLADTTIGHRQDDMKDFAADYPVLPVRRRFWENTLRVLDPTGTESQVRNQLTLVHKAIRTNLDESLGHVVPADYLYFDSAERLLQHRMLPRKLYEKTKRWIEGTAQEQLTARACALVFLVNKLSANNEEIGIKATVNTIVDLLVDDLPLGSSGLRSQLPGLLDNCELLMKVKDGYRIQTEESTAWNDEFLGQRSQLANESHRIEAERDDRIRKKFMELAGKLSILQGKAKISREIYTAFNTQIPSDCQDKVCAWVRDGWSSDENSVRADARQAGSQSPTIFIFIPKRSVDILRNQLIDYKAAATTLEIRGVPISPEGIDARSAMETTKQTAEAKINQLLEEALSGARVFQGGGNEIIGNNLQEMILEAAEKSLMRLYPNFNIADQTGWDKVYSRAKLGSPDALKAIGHDGEPEKNPVCKAILAFIGGGKKGSDIRSHFEAPPYGWSRDAVDGTLQVLLTSGLIHARDERQQAVDPKNLERKLIGKANFKVESTTVTVMQRITVRKLLQKLDCPAKPNEELAAIPLFIDRLLELAHRAGGEAPKPRQPDTSELEEIRRTYGNEQILAIYNRYDSLNSQIDDWTDQAKRIDSRWPSWLGLQELLSQAGDLKEAQETQHQVTAIENQRLLLDEPDPVRPLAKSLENALRKELNHRMQQYASKLAKQEKALESDAAWQKITKDEREQIKQQCDITGVPVLNIGTCEELINALKQYPLPGWNDRTDALAGRFARARELAAKILEPETQAIDIPRRTIRSQEDIKSWLQEVEQQLKTALEKGPVVIR